MSGILKLLRPIYCCCFPGFTTVKFFASISLFLGMQMLSASSFTLGIAIDQDENLKKFHMGKRASAAGIIFGSLQFFLSLMFLYVPKKMSELWLKLWMGFQLLLIVVFSVYRIYFWSVEDPENPFHIIYRGIFVFNICFSIIFFWIGVTFCFTLHGTTSEELMSGNDRLQRKGCFSSCLPCCPEDEPNNFILKVLYKYCSYPRAKTVKKIAVISAIFQVILVAASNGCIAPLEGITVAPPSEQNTNEEPSTSIDIEHLYSMLGNGCVFSKILFTLLMLVLPSEIANWRLTLLILIQGLLTSGLIACYIFLIGATTSDFRWVFYIFYGIDIIYSVYLILIAVVIICKGGFRKPSNVAVGAVQDIVLNSNRL